MYKSYARLYSEIIPPTDDLPACFEFYYYMHTKQGQELQVKVAEYNKAEQTLWKLHSKNVTSEDVWYLGKLPIYADDIFRIYFDGLTGPSGRAFVGKCVVISATLSKHSK